MSDLPKTGWTSKVGKEVVLDFSTDHLVRWKYRGTTRWYTWARANFLRRFSEK